MLNTANWDPLHVANYVADYLDLVESLPFDLQRNVSHMKEIDAKYQEILTELDEVYARHGQEEDPAQQRRLLLCVQGALIRSQALGDEKLQLAGQMVELVENRSRQADCLAQLLETPRHHRGNGTEAHESVAAATVGGVVAVPMSKRREEDGNNNKRREEALVGSVADRLSGGGGNGNKRLRRQKNNSSSSSGGGGNENRENSISSSACHHDDTVAVATVAVATVATAREKRASKASKKKKNRSKGKAEREAAEREADLPIDPNEPTYCLCEQVSYGEMIGCDNDECPIEWFHFSCVQLHHKPKGKWYCPKCRGDTEKTMDKALEKSKKERAYNR